MKSQYPGIAGLAAQVEMFGLSKRDIEKKFTRSEMALLAWRSQEIAAQLEKSTESSATVPPKRRYSNAQLPEGLPDRFFNEEGEIDLRQVPGEDAYKFLALQGMQLPIMTGRRDKG